MYLGFLSVKWGDHNCVSSFCCPNSYFTSDFSHVCSGPVLAATTHFPESHQGLASLLSSLGRLPSPGGNPWTVGHGNQWINAPASWPSAGQLQEASSHFSGGPVDQVPVAHRGVQIMHPLIDAFFSLPCLIFSSPHSRPQGSPPQNQLHKALVSNSIFRGIQVRQ